MMAYVVRISDVGAAHPGHPLLRSHGPRGCTAIVSTSARRAGARMSSIARIPAKVITAAAAPRRMINGRGSPRTVTSDVCVMDDLLPLAQSAQHLDEQLVQVFGTAHRRTVRDQVCGRHERAAVLPPAEPAVAAHELLERGDLRSRGIDDAVDVDVGCL